jgi:hypothetical protein
MSPIQGPSGPAAWQNWAGVLAFTPVPGAGQAPFGLEDVHAPLRELLLTPAASIHRGMEQEKSPARLIDWSRRLQTRVAELRGNLEAHTARHGSDPTAAMTVAERRLQEAEIGQLQSLADWIDAEVANRSADVDVQPDVAAYRHLWSFRQQQTAVAATYLEYTQAAQGGHMGADLPGGPHTVGLEAGRANDAYYNMMFVLTSFERRACVRVLDSTEASFLAQWRIYAAMDPTVRVGLAVPIAATGLELMHLTRIAGDLAFSYPHLPDFSAAAGLASRDGDVNLPPMDIESRDLNEEVRASNLRAHFVRHAGANGSFHNAIGQTFGILAERATASNSLVSEPYTHAVEAAMQAHGAIRDALVEFRRAVGEVLWNDEGENSPMALDLASRAAERSPDGGPTVRNLPETASYTVLVGFNAAEERIGEASNEMMKARAALSSAIRSMTAALDHHEQPDAPSRQALASLREVAEKVMDKMFASSDADAPSTGQAALIEFVDAAANYAPLLRNGSAGPIDNSHWIEIAVTQILSPEADRMFFATQGPGRQPLMD